MNNEQLEEQYEAFEGDLRKLDELIGQLELWSDEYTINHKKEEVRLPEYIELHLNLEEMKQIIDTFINERLEEEGQTEKITAYQAQISEKLEKYKEAEHTIHEWVRAIKNIQIIIARTPSLEENKAYIETILNH